MAFETVEEAQKAFEEQAATLATLQESVTKLETNNKALVDEKKEVARIAKEAKAAEDAAKLEAAKKGGDIDTLQKSYDEKLLGVEESYKGKFSMFENKFKDQTVDAIASELFDPDAASIGRQSIAGRIRVDTSGEDVKVIVLDASGQPSAMTVDEYKAEITGDKAFSRILKGSQASGAGGLGGSGGGGTGKTMTRAQFDEMSPAQQSEFSIGGGKLQD